MSLQSMTGFGKAEKNRPEGYISVELRSVNNRYTDIQFKIPRNLNILEPQMRKILESHCSRGSFTCSIQYNSTQKKAAKVQLQEALLDDYLEIIKKVHSKLNTPSTIDVAELLRAPELVQITPIKSNSKDLEKEVLPLFTEASVQLQEMRMLEGKNILLDITQRIENLAQWIPTIKKILPDRQKEYATKIKARLTELTRMDIHIPEERVLSEIALMVDKMDITEEVVRFESHVVLFKSTLEEASSPGKKLGFILQEMLREVNTMGNKSQYVEIQHQCVNVKEEIEKIREQVMNIE